LAILKLPGGLHVFWRINRITIILAIIGHACIIDKQAVEV
jgi:hypothetical protein